MCSSSFALDYKDHACYSANNIKPHRCTELGACIMHLRTAVIQLNSRDNPAENLATVERFLDHAASMGAQFVGLPEFWTYLGPYVGFAGAAQTIPGPAIERLQEKAC